MAQAKKKRPFLWVVIILLFIGLLGFGTGGLNGTIRSIGSAGDKDIPIALYRGELNNQLRALSAQFGTTVGFQQAQALGLDQAVIAQVVGQRTLDNEASELGLSVGDVRVRDGVLGEAAFRGLDGEFSREIYTEQLRRIGQSEAEFEDSVRDGISRTLLQGAVMDGVPAPTAYAETLIQFVGETRDITYARVGADDLQEPVPGPTDADIDAYYEANGASFMRPEQREITYVWLTPSMIQDELEVDETALRELYDERIDEFVQPERRLVERLPFLDAQTADAAAARVAAGEAGFDDLVEERGLTLTDVDLGDVSADDLGDAGDGVFGAETGAVVGPLPSDVGPALFRVNAVLSAEEVTFEEAAPDLREELATQRARRVIDQANEGITDLMAGGATLEDLAERTDLVLGTIAFSAETTDGIAAYDNFRDAAAAVSEGEYPELLQLSDGGVFALRLDGVTAAAQKPLEEVRDEVATAWTAERTQQMVLARADEIVAQISPLTDFATLELDAEEADNLLRRSFVEDTPTDFMSQVFEMEITTVRVVDAGDDAIIVRLDLIQPPDTESEQTRAALAQAGDSAAAGIAQDLMQAFSAKVQQRTEITLNQAAINAVHAQMQ